MKKLASVLLITVLVFSFSSLVAFAADSNGRLKPSNVMAVDYDDPLKP